FVFLFFFSSRRRHTRSDRDWSSDVCSSDLVEGADKRWVLRHCQFMAAPSLEESFGNAALEAMACGKPVVVSGASGLAEFLGNGRSEERRVGKEWRWGWGQEQ